MDSGELKKIGIFSCGSTDDWYVRMHGIGSLVCMNLSVIEFQSSVKKMITPSCLFDNDVTTFFRSKLLMILINNP